MKLLCRALLTALLFGSPFAFSPADAQERAATLKEVFEEWTPLMQASAMGDLAELKALLKKKADPNAKNKKGDTALIIAAREGELEIVKALIKAKADVNAQNDHDETALEQASLAGDLAIVKALLKAKANPNAKNRFSPTALSAASGQGELAIVKALLEAKADPNQQGEDGETALIAAAKAGAVEIVKRLIDAKADPDIQDERGETALLSACCSSPNDDEETLKIARLLIDAGADVNLKDRWGLTALRCAWEEEDLSGLLLKAGADPKIEDEHGNSYEKLWKAAAELPSDEEPNRSGDQSFWTSRDPMAETLLRTAYEGDAEKTRFWLEKGAPVDARNADNQTPLYLAACKNHADVVAALIDAGADLNARDSIFEDTPLIALSHSDHHATIVRYLIAAGADVNAKNKKDDTALQTACMMGASKIAKLLVDAGADLEVKSGPLGKTPLMEASSSGNASIVKLLLKAGANVNARSPLNATPLQFADKSPEVVRALIKAGANVNEQAAYNADGGFTHLMAAVNRGEIRIAKLLIDAGADVNALSGPRGWTPLLLAVGQKKPNPQMVRLLLDSGADVNAQNQHGENALSFAVFNNNPQMVKLLLRAGAKINARAGKDQLPVRSEPLQKPGDTALMLAIAAHHWRMADLLILSGADVNLANDRGTTPLMRALPSFSSFGSELEARLLLQKLIKAGAHVNAKDQDGNTALHYAVDRAGANFKAAQLLLKAGADVNAQNQKGERPIDRVPDIEEKIKALLEAAAQASPI